MFESKDKDIEDGEYQCNCCGGNESACPFSHTHNAEYFSNMACLPDVFEILENKRETGRDWACHDDESKMCVGYAKHIKEYCKELSIDKTKPMSTLTEWNEKGFPTTEMENK